MFLKRFIFLFILTIFTGNAMAENANEKLLIELSHGDVVVELHSDIAPLHVDRIKTLAKDGFYDGIIFHRVIEGFMAQTGDPTGTGYGGSDYPDLTAEFSNKPFERGTIGMARSSNPNSGNSQFFICFEPAPFLNGQYTVWGTVIEGMENVDKIARGEPPANPDKIIKMTVVE